MSGPGEATKAYLEYLDKEMTIMGILSTFCVAAAALVVDRVASAEKDSLFHSLAGTHPFQVFLGAGLLMGAGLFFYLQRSRLAHFYGSICMSVAEPDCTEWDTQRWLVEAYSWATWIKYRIAFLLLALTPVVFVHALYQTMRPAWPPLWGWEWGIVAAITIGILGHTTVYSTYRYSNHPYRSFSARTFLRDWRNRKNPPSGSLPRNPRR